ncbi:MAG: hypothetical protein RL414_691 [Actinomycetota bacterium]
MRRYAHFLARPTAPYFIILTSVAALSGLGLVMVLSASSVKSVTQNGTAYSIFAKQALFLSIGLIALYYGSRMKLQIWERLAKVAIPLSVVGLLLPQLPFIGREINGNKSWIGLGPFTLQPAEFAKLSLILFCAMQLKRFDQRAARKEEKQSPRELIFHLVPGAGIMILLILLGKDLGTALIVISITAAMIFLSGTPLRNLTSLAMGAGALIAVMVVTQPHRMRRLSAFMHPFDPEVYKFAGWQTAHSIMGLASGGLFGVGLGASRQKWGNLSEANTDFIFSVIGEELGLLGTLLVLSLFAALIYGIFRTALHCEDLFTRYVCGGVGAWLLFQVLVNVASAIGVFPVVGVTLPFMSYGGSSLIANLLAISFVLNVLRRNPEVRQAIQGRKEARRA